MVKKTASWATFIVLMVLHVPPVFGFVRLDRGKDVLINQVMRLTGINEQVEQIPANMEAQLVEEQLREGAIDPAFYKRFRSVVLEAYNAERFHQAIVKALHDSYNREYLLGIYERWQSPLLRRIRDLEVRSTMPEREERLSRYVRHIQENPPPKERVRLVGRLIEATYSVEFTVAILEGIFMAFLEPVNEMKPDNEKITHAQLALLADSFRNEIIEPVEYQIFMSALLTYESLTDEELENYVEFQETPSASWLTRIYLRAIKEEFDVAAKEVGKELAANLSEMKKRETGEDFVTRDIP